MFSLFCTLTLSFSTCYLYHTSCFFFFFFFFHFFKSLL